MRTLILSVPLLIAAGASNAATYNSAVVRATCGVVPNVETHILSSEIGALSVSASAPVGSDANCAADATAFAGAGVARVFATVENTGSNAEDPGLIDSDASAFAAVAYDLVVSAPGGERDPFDFSINMDASGSISAFSRKLISDTEAFLNPAQTISALLTISGSLGSGGQSETFEETINVRVNPGDAGSSSLSGAFTTPSITVRPGDLISYVFRLSGGTGGNLQGAAASGVVDADQSLSFTTSGSVFNMPDGYTVDIDEPRIIDNRYYTPEMALPGETVAPSPVPLPAAGWALLSGVLALLTLKRRQKTV